VPVRDTTGKAKVSAVDVSEAEIEAFKDKVKAVIRVDSGACLAPTDDIPPSIMIDEAREIGNEIALVKVKPETDVQVQSWYNEALGLQKYAEARIIKTVEDLKPANDDLVTIRRLKKALEEKRKEYVKPLQDHVKSINDTFKTFMEPIEIADKVTSQKMLAFTSEQDRIRSEQERINAERVKLAQDEMKLTGEISESVNLIEVIAPPSNHIRTEVGISSIIKRWEFLVEDFSILPDQYKLPDMVKIRKVITAGATIPGVRSWKEDNLRTTPIKA